MNDNPYEAPSANLIENSVESESVSIREAHIKHEASVKSIGVLYYFGGVSMLIAAAGMLLVFSESTSASGEFGNFELYIGAFYLIFGAASLVVGRGLRTLRRWVRVPVAILSGLGLLSIPVGTIINGYILYLVFSAKGKTVLSDDYKKIISLTPEIKYKTPAWVWVLLFIVIVLIAVALYFAFIGDIPVD